MYRVENKYVCQKTDLALLQSRLESVLKSDENQKSYSGYTVTSIYFDDLFDSYLNDTIDGNCKREKYRIRIYNHSWEVIKLEVKYKKYNYVMKKTRQISKEQMWSLMAGESVRQSNMSLDNPVILFNLAIKERGLRPRVIVEYDRKAYVFESGNVRITLDRNLRCSRQVDRFGRKEIIFDNIKEANNILEVKYDEFLPGFIAQLLETSHMNQSSYSKYRLCREASEGKWI
ncbi:MAG: polyphosphate polymerase domain-containing protein [Lachnospiraceae bacterium]|nr:polyphosphate polymerase domain-containing protein [Lachnospiraceae bacterium]